MNKHGFYHLIITSHVYSSIKNVRVLFIFQCFYIESPKMTIEKDTLRVKKTVAFTF